MFGNYDDLWSKVASALELAESYGTVDGGHHKMWVIDQMVRVLLGSDEAYKKWVKEFEGPEDEDGYTEYEWDEGIAP